MSTLPSAIVRLPTEHRAPGVLRQPVAPRSLVLRTPFLALVPEPAGPDFDAADFNPADFST
jgi:hypothetical protein